MGLYAGFIHIFLATLALVVLCGAALQALLLASQEWILKHKQAIGFIQYFPSLQAMETFLFALITLAIVLLTLILITSLILFYPVSEQILWQKTILSLLAWSVFLILLVGRSYFGWRGKIAISWTLIGVGLIGIVYLGAIFFTPDL